jgi:hypothetical protein
MRSRHTHKVIPGHRFGLAVEELLASCVARRAPLSFPAGTPYCLGWDGRPGLRFRCFTATLARTRPKRRTQRRGNATARAQGASFVGSPSAGSGSNQLDGFERLGLGRCTLYFIDRKKTPTARPFFVGEIAIPKSSPWAADDSIEIDAGRVW